MWWTKEGLKGEVTSFKFQVAGIRGNYPFLLSCFSCVSWANKSSFRVPSFEFRVADPRRSHPRSSQKTQFATEVTEASRRGTERCIGVNAIASFTRRVIPNSPRPDPKAFLCELLFALSGLCDEIGLRNLGSSVTSAVKIFRKGRARGAPLRCPHSRSFVPRACRAK
jgi:hypothetical protein